MAEVLGLAGDESPSLGIAVKRISFDQSLVFGGCWLVWREDRFRGKRGILTSGTLYSRERSKIQHRPKEFHN